MFNTQPIHTDVMVWFSKAKLPGNLVVHLCNTNLFVFFFVVFDFEIRKIKVKNKKWNKINQTMVGTCIILFLFFIFRRCSYFLLAEFQLTGHYNFKMYQIAAVFFVHFTLWNIQKVNDGFQKVFVTQWVIS